MPAKGTESERPFSPASELASWARQGIESFVSAQKILLDLTAQQNALVLGIVREGLSKPIFRPGAAIARFADKGLEALPLPAKFCWISLPARPRWWWTD